MSQYLIEELRTRQHRNGAADAVVRVSGGSQLEAIATRTEPGEQVRERHADALFAFIGADTETACCPPRSSATNGATCAWAATSRAGRRARAVPARE